MYSVKATQALNTYAVLDSYERALRDGAYEKARGIARANPDLKEQLRDVARRVKTDDQS